MYCACLSELSSKAWGREVWLVQGLMGGSHMQKVYFCIIFLTFHKVVIQNVSNNICDFFHIATIGEDGLKCIPRLTI